MSESEWLSVAEAAEKVGVTPETIRGWLRADGAEVLVMGRRWRFRRDDFEQLLARRLEVLEAQEVSK